MRLIDADAIHIPKMETGFDDTLMRIFIANTPTVDAVKVVHGRWINDRLLSTGGGDYLIKRCSECRNYWFAGMSGGWNYCPKCGAKMDEVTE